VDQRVRQEINEVPEIVKKKKSQYEKLLSEIQNYLNFIRMGNLSKMISGALAVSESKSLDLKQEIDSLVYQQQNTFRAPPKEWIRSRLNHLFKTLNQYPKTTTLALKEILGPIALEPISEQESDRYQILSSGEKKFKPYYIFIRKYKSYQIILARVRIGCIGGESGI
jgi:hypothetical protein